MTRAFLLATACALGGAGWAAIVLWSPWAGFALAMAGVLGILTLGNAIVHGRWRPW